MKIIIFLHIYFPLGSISVFSVGKLRLNWILWGDITCSAFAFLEAVILLASSYSYNIWFLYTGYIIFGIIYHTMVTVARSVLILNIHLT
jgi:thiamine transporter 2/3